MSNGFKCPLIEKGIRFRKVEGNLVTQGKLEHIKGGRYTSWIDVYRGVCDSCIANSNNSCQPEAAEQCIIILKGNTILPDTSYNL